MACIQAVSIVFMKVLKKKKNIKKVKWRPRDVTLKS